MTKIYIKDLHIVLERFGTFYIYDGCSTKVFDSIKDFRRYLLNNDINNIASLDLSLQDLDVENCLEVLELLVFVYPTCKAAPLVKSVAEFLKLKQPDSEREEVEVIYRVVEELINKIDYNNPTINSVFTYMGLTEWKWAGFLNTYFKVDFLKAGEGIFNNPEQKYLMPILKKLPKWEYDLANDFSDVIVGEVREEHVKKTLETIINTKGGLERPQQLEYSYNLAKNFDFSKNLSGTNLAILQAPTGVGKTIGYLAPSLVCAKQNKAPVWISTFTKNLQAQVQESLTEFDDIKIALRKGKQNYLCLLKTQQLFEKQKKFFNGFVVLWLTETKDGDIVSGDFPQWLFSIHKKKQIDFVDCENSCVYSACPHFKRCYTQSSVQNANNADIIVANHALSILEGLVTMDSGSRLPPVVIFDEAHELYSAVDDVFSSFLSAAELIDFADFLGLRKKKGLLQRLHEVIQMFPNDEGIYDRMGQIQKLEKHFPALDWFNRCSVEDVKEENISQRFFNVIYKVVLQQNQKNGYSNLQADISSLFEEDKNTEKEQSVKLVPQARDMLQLLGDINKHLNIINDKIDVLVNENFKDEPDSDLISLQIKLQGLQNSIKVKQQYTIESWVNALKTPNDEKFSIFLVLNIAKDGRVFDVGVKCHFVNPMKPFAKKVLSHISSASLTSATIVDKEIQSKEEWETSLKMTGVDYVEHKELNLYETKSPFDYPKQAKVIIVNDVDYRNKADLAKAMLELFLANKGSSLGIFTAISRLQSVYPALKRGLKKNKINLYAQHMQSLDVATLVDVFAEDKKSCLIGTDALKQGVDVTGGSLSLVVCDKLPRPVPSILMKAREKEYGRKYRNLLTRMSLKQAFGRLIRTTEDKGVFVLLDPRINRSEIKAFPPELEVQKISLKEAIEIIKSSK